MEVSGQLHAQAALSPGKRPWYPCIGGWVGPRAGLHTVIKRKKSQPLPELEPQIIRPVAQRYSRELSRLLLQKSVTTIFLHLREREREREEVTRSWRKLHSEEL